MRILFKVIILFIMLLWTSIGYADEAKKIISEVSDKISSFITNTLGGGGLTEFSIDIPEDDVEIQYLNFKELSKDDLSNTFSQLSINTKKSMMIQDIF